MRSAAYVATRFQSREQEMVIEHSLLWSECGENSAYIERNSPCDEGQIAGDAGVVHGKDIEAAQPAQQNHCGGPRSDPLDAAEQPPCLQTGKLFQHGFVQTARYKRVSHPPECCQLVRAQACTQQNVIACNLQTLRTRKGMKGRALADNNRTER